MKKLAALAVVLLLIASLVLPAAAYADGPNKEAKDVKITKRVGIDGKSFRGNVPTAAQHRQGGQAASGKLGAPLPAGGQSYAILIGISDYLYSEQHILDGGFDLSYGADDAMDMMMVLAGVYGFNPDNITLLVDGAATRENILNAIEELKAKSTNKDEIVFHFSGHGVAGVADDGDREQVDEGIVPSDGVPDPLDPYNVIWDGELKAAFKKVKANRMVFIFDGCSGGWEDMEGNKTIVITAVGETGLALEYGEDYGPVPGVPYMNNGVFTYFFAELGLGGGVADLPEYGGNGDGNVTIEEAFDFAKANILSYMDIILYMLAELGYEVSAEDETPTIIDRFSNDLLLGYTK